MKKGSLTTILLILILLIGLSLLLYPTVSNYVNEKNSTKAIANYTDAVAEMKEEDFSSIWQSAWEYNASLLLRSNKYLLTEEQAERYPNELNIGGHGIMCHIEIPSLQVKIPIYHGTSEDVLQVAVGHIEWSSLPVGGESSHCVVSGHRGLPSAKLFTDLDEVVVGDVFMLHTLGETLTYQVDQILIVEPHETQALMVEEGKDYCTLVTCTPYGVNTHRLLVRGTRVETPEEIRQVYVTADAVRIEPTVVAPVVAAPMLLVLFVLVMLKPSKPRKK